MKSEECLQFIRKHIDEQKLGELSQNIGVSKTVLSLIASGKYRHNWQAIEKKLSSFVCTQNIGFKDERRLVSIYAILDEAENREGLIAAIALRR